MYGAVKFRNRMIVDLTEKVFVRTTIPKESHAALRAGFAGYPANPRWNVRKYRAWKIGCRWREELNIGKKMVRSEDSMLVPVVNTGAEVGLKKNKRIEENSSSRSPFFPVWAIQLATLNHQ